MASILAVGYDPDFLDLSGAGLPPSITAEQIHKGVERGLQTMTDRGWDAEHCSIRPDAEAALKVQQKLADKSYDLVIIGAGVRLAADHLDVFEAVINTVHAAAPGAKIAFNSGLDDMADAAARWILKG